MPTPSSAAPSWQGACSDRVAACSCRHLAAASWLQPGGGACPGSSQYLGHSRECLHPYACGMPAACAAAAGDCAAVRAPLLPGAGHVSPPLCSEATLLARKKCAVACEPCNLPHPACARAQPFNTRVAYLPAGSSIGRCAAAAGAGTLPDHPCLPAPFADALKVASPDVCLQGHGVCSSPGGSGPQRTCKAVVCLRAQRGCPPRPAPRGVLA